MNYNRIVEVSALTTGYRGARVNSVVSSSLDLQACAGDLIMLMGPNGSGKSTLMRTISGLIAPLEGEVKIAGQLTQGIKEQDRAKLMSIVLTERIEHSTLSVWDIVSTGRYPHLGWRGKLHREDIKLLDHYLEVCNAERLKYRCFSELSDGEKQRVMIVRALAQDTPLMLLDEPTAHLDLPSRLEILSMLRRLSRELGKCILVSTHELDLALQWADVIWLFDKEEGIRSAAPEDLVLSGDIERVFGNDDLHFDSNSGEFRLIETKVRAVTLLAQGLRHSWATRALLRMGYSVVEKRCEEFPLIISEKSGWRLCYHDKELYVSDLWSLQQNLKQYYPPKF